MANERGAHVYADLGISQQRKSGKRVNSNVEDDRKGKLMNANAEPKKGVRKLTGKAAATALQSETERANPQLQNANEECYRAPRQVNASFESKRK